MIGSRAAEVRRLAELHDKDGKLLQAEDVFEASKDAKSYPRMHEYIWGKSQAELARERQIQLCHQLIISIKISTVHHLPQRVFVHNRSIQGYRPIERVVSSYDLASQQLEKLADDVDRARQRLSAFKAMLPDEVADAIEASMEATMRLVRGTLEQRRQQPPSAEAS